MKKRNNKLIIILAIAVCTMLNAMGQDSVKNDLVLGIRYFANNNKLAYVMINTKTKIDSKWKPVRNSVVNLYLESKSDSSFIGKLTTDESGSAKTFIPTSLKAAWDATATHKLVGTSEAGNGFDPTTEEISVTKSKISIDTLSDGDKRSIMVSVFAKEGDEWIPAPDVEMKVGIKRLGGIMSAGDQEVYTTDSTGTVTVEMNKDSLPGDTKGNIILTAKVEDNDQLGNLLVERTVSWGTPLIVDNSFFNQRTLWSTRFRTPPWLLFLAYSIVIGVWGTILYLVWQLILIKKLSKEQPDQIA